MAYGAIAGSRGGDQCDQTFRRYLMLRTSENSLRNLFLEYICNGCFAIVAARPSAKRLQVNKLACHFNVLYAVPSQYFLDYTVYIN